jgi:hypothetical protein
MWNQFASDLSPEIGNETTAIKPDPPNNPFEVGCLSDNPLEAGGLSDNPFAVEGGLFKCRADRMHKPL